MRLGSNFFVDCNGNGAEGLAALNGALLAPHWPVLGLASASVPHHPHGQSASAGEHPCRPLSEATEGTVESTGTPALSSLRRLML
jgi:hypothetical protein